MPWFRGLESIVRERVPLAQMNNYRVGGTAEFFAEPPGEEALSMVLRRAADEAVPVRMLGHGTNLLVADEGVSGLIVRLPKHAFSDLTHEGTHVTVGAGHSLPGLVKWSANAGYAGLECLAGVPGTVGAALRMNAGGKYGEIGARVTRVRGVEMDGTPFDCAREACGFVYRDSGLRGRIVTRCEMDVEASDAEACWTHVRSILAEKSATQPLKDRSGGCVFKNPKRPNTPPAGKIIDLMGMKGVRIGGAQVSTKHANFLICHPGAKAADMVALIRLIRERALLECGVELELEIETWGVDPDALKARVA
ncbi:MAG: UDP-N-acetylmuramate dehydrogenase [Planctomycetota bacterium]|nr:UDP-N-acetylmuramate dehydrogenase [Planctomycetota bacterium]